MRLQTSGIQAAMDGAGSPAGAAGGRRQSRHWLPHSPSIIITDDDIHHLWRALCRPISLHHISLHHDHLFFQLFLHLAHIDL